MRRFSLYVRQVSQWVRLLPAPPPIILPHTASSHINWLSLQLISGKDTVNMREIWALLQSTWGKNKRYCSQHEGDMSATAVNMREIWALLQSTWGRYERYCSQHEGKISDTAVNMREIWALLQSTWGKNKRYCSQHEGKISATAVNMREK